MKLFSSGLALVCAIAPCAWSQTGQATSPATQSAPTGISAIPADANTLKAKAIIEQGIQALGGDAWLNIRDREQQGRGYILHHGQSTSGGVIFWSFFEFPDKERVELTKERDVTELYVDNKGYEITYKGVRAIEQKDLIDYLRRRRFSLETVLRTWVKDPTVIVLFEGNAIAAQHPAYKITLVNAKDESVSLFFDTDSHLPVKKSFEWRDPVDRQKNLEEEVYENYRPVSGIMTPYNTTRFFNGDMAGQRFLSNVTINQGLDQTMFDPNSHYDPNKVKGKK